MKKELDEKLCAKYPKIFVNRHGDMETTALCWGFDCGDGWYWLIDRLCSNLQFNTDNNNRWSDGNEGRNPQIVASQVKEKYGGLRFYVESATEAQHAVISFAESLSYHVCEKCGSTKNIGHTKGWISTLCENCKDDTKYIWVREEDEENEKQF